MRPALMNGIAPNAKFAPYFIDFCVEVSYSLSSLAKFVEFPPTLPTAEACTVLDNLDARLLSALQRDSDRPLHAVAEEIGLSVSACHRRQRLLEDNGQIAGYAARLDPKALGYSFEIFVEITLSAQTEAALDAFEKAVAATEEILECHLVSGEGDYRLRLAARDMEHFDRLHRERLAKLPGVAAMKSSVAIRVVKPWRGYPVRS